MAKGKTWLILTGSGNYLRGRYRGTKTQATKYCREHYLPKAYKLVEDKVKK